MLSLSTLVLEKSILPNIFVSSVQENEAGIDLLLVGKLKSWIMNNIQGPILNCIF